MEEHCYFENTDGNVMLQALPNAVTVRLLSIDHDTLTKLWIVPQRQANQRWSGEPNSPSVCC